MAIGLLAMPLLAAMGGAAMASGALPHIENYQKRVRGRYQGGLLAGMDDASPRDRQRALFGGGLLDADELMDFEQQAFEGEQDRLNALQRTRISSGPGYMNAQLAREKFEAEQERLAAQTELVGVARSAEDEALVAAGLPREFLAIPSLREDGLNSLGETLFPGKQDPGERDRLAREAYLRRQGMSEGELRVPELANAALAADVERRYGSTEPAFEAGAGQVIEARNSYLLAEAALQPLDDAISLVEDQNPWQRIGGADVVAVETRLAKTVLPMLQKLTEAGALTDDEYLRFVDELSVGGWSAGRTIARLKAIRQTASRFGREQRQLFNATTTPAQRKALSQGTPAPGGAGNPPPGTVAGVSE